MNKSALVQARLDPQTKRKAGDILKALDITYSEAISMFFRQIVLNGGIPFPLRIPNKETAKALEDADSGKKVKAFDSVDDLFEELES